MKVNTLLFTFILYGFTLGFSTHLFSMEYPTADILKTENEEQKSLKQSAPQKNARSQNSSSIALPNSSEFLSKKTDIFEELFQHLDTELFNKIYQPEIIKNIQALVANQFDRLSLLPQCTTKLLIPEVSMGNYSSLSSDKRFFLYSDSSTMSIIDTLNPTNIITISGPNIDPKLIFYQNSPCIFYKKFNQNLVIWDILQHKALYEIPMPSSIRYIPNSIGNYIIAYDQTAKSACLCDLSENLLKSLDFDTPIIEIKWLNETIFILVTKQNVMIINAADGTLLRTITIDGALIPNKAILATTYAHFPHIILQHPGSEERIVIINTQTNKWISRDFKSKSVSTAQIIPHLNVFALANNQENSIEIYDINNLQLLKTIHYKYESFDKKIRIENYPQACIVIPNSPLIVTYCFNGYNAHIWNIKTGEYVGGFSTNHDSLRALEIGDDNTIVAICQKSISYFDFSTSFEKYLILKKLTHAMQTENAQELEELLECSCVKNESIEFQQLLQRIFNTEKSNLNLLTHSLDEPISDHLTLLALLKNNSLHLANMVKTNFNKTVTWLKSDKKASLHIFLILTVLLTSNSSALTNKFTSLYGMPPLSFIIQKIAPSFYNQYKHLLDTKKGAIKVIRLLIIMYPALVTEIAFLSYFL